MKNNFTIFSLPLILLFATISCATFKKSMTLELSSNFIPIHANPKVGDFAIYNIRLGIFKKDFWFLPSTDMGMFKYKIVKIEEESIEVMSLGDIKFFGKYCCQLFRLDRKGYVKKAFITDLSGKILEEIDQVLKDKPYYKYVFSVASSDIETLYAFPSLIKNIVKPTSSIIIPERIKLNNEKFHSYRIRLNNEISAFIHPKVNFLSIKIKLGKTAPILIELVEYGNEKQTASN